MQNEDMELKYVYSYIMDMEKNAESLLQINDLFEMLFSHFFSKNRHPYSIETVRSFIQMVYEHNDISQAVIASYLKEILNATSKQGILDQEVIYLLSKKRSVFLQHLYIIYIIKI